MKLYEGSLFVLLGHNGAGKSTTVSMLTGLYPPTSGDASMYGLSVVHQMSLIQRQMGVCPQHDVLYEKLTVREHIELYQALKGIDFRADQAKADVSALLQKVGLKEKADAFTDALSGGMKRKLSVAIALINAPKVVFLDEPTSGMDPHSRRAIWSLLEQEKRNRVVVLTTHFMDEADILGDRIAIMSAGRLRVLGSSLFLKSRFGIGYTLTIDLTSATTRGAVVDVVRKHVAAAEMISEAGSELSMRLPLAATPSFPALFVALDDAIAAAALGVAAYGVSVTSLEEVFIRLAGDSHEHSTAEASAEETPVAAKALAELESSTESLASLGADTGVRTRTLSQLHMDKSGMQGTGYVAPAEVHGRSPASPYAALEVAPYADKASRGGGHASADTRTQIAALVAKRVSMARRDPAFTRMQVPDTTAVSYCSFCVRADSSLCVCAGGAFSNGAFLGCVRFTQCT
jgi:ABC-type multidrug transport system ATPase subunit